MKKLRGSFAAKLVAVIALCVLVVICVLAAVGTAYLSDSDAYSMDLKQAEERAIENQAVGWLYDAAQGYKEGNTPPQLTHTNFSSIQVSLNKMHYISWKIFAKIGFCIDLKHFLFVCRLICKKAKIIIPCNSP